MDVQAGPFAFFSSCSSFLRESRLGTSQEICLSPFPKTPGPGPKARSGPSKTQNPLARDSGERSASPGPAHLQGLPERGLRDRPHQPGVPEERRHVGGAQGEAPPEGQGAEGDDAGSGAGGKAVQGKGAGGKKGQGEWGRVADLCLSKESSVRKGEIRPGQSCAGQEGQEEAEECDLHLKNRRGCHGFFANFCSWHSQSERPAFLCRLASDFRRPLECFG